MRQGIRPTQIPDDQLIVAFLLVRFLISDWGLFRLVNTDQGITVNFVVLESRVRLNDLIVASGVTFAAF
jgi:hypothetical protein